MAATRDMTNIDTIAERAHNNHQRDRWSVMPASAYLDGEPAGIDEVTFAEAMAGQIEVSAFLAREADTFDEFLTHFVTEREATALCDYAVGEF